MARAAWFNCFSGIAGDMALGSLIDAGADVEAVRSTLKSLPATGWSIETETTQRAGVRATRVLVEVAEDDHIVRTYRTIKAMLQSAELPPRVLTRSLSVFEKLAAAEGRIHDQDPDDVHFHEVGSLDAIVDVVGTCAALEDLRIDHVFSSAVATGVGTVRSAHGILPNPAPAVVELLREAPVFGVERSMELTTPTGAAILSALCERFGAMPTFARLENSGFGAGTRDLNGIPNCTQVVIGELVEEVHVSPHGQPVLVLEANLDDATGEVIAHAIAALITAGAHDAWTTPVIMKKGRPGYIVSALVDVHDAGRVGDVLINETGSFGVRGVTAERWPARREFSSVSIDGEDIAIKSAPHRSKAEFEDAARIANNQDEPVREVISRAEAAHRDTDTE